MTDQRMIQLEVLQEADGLLPIVYRISDEALIFLDPDKKAVVREITAEEMGGILDNTTVAYVGPGTPFTELMLVFQNRERREWFYAPSHVASPPVTGAIGAILRVSEEGIDAGANLLSVSRRIGAHAYIDLID